MSLPNAACGDDDDEKTGEEGHYDNIIAPESSLRVTCVSCSCGNNAGAGVVHGVVHSIGGDAQVCQSCLSPVQGLWVLCGRTCHRCMDTTTATAGLHHTMRDCSPAVGSTTPQWPHSILWAQIEHRGLMAGRGFNAEYCDERLWLEIAPGSHIDAASQLLPDEDDGFDFCNIDD